MVSSSEQPTNGTDVMAAMAVRRRNLRIVLYKVWCWALEMHARESAGVGNR